MTLRWTRRISLVAAASVAIIAPAAMAMPEVFFNGQFESAERLAAEDQKLLLIDFTAVWCVPCKQMDKTTWIEDEVVSWIRDNAIAVQVDVDEQRGVAQKYKIRAMPTIIVVKNGEEFDRVVGYQSSEQLLAWLGDVQQGNRAVDAVREQVHTEDGDSTNVMARMELARMLLNNGDYAEATTEYLWLWENMLQHMPSMVGVRLSFMLSEIEQLMAVHPLAKQKFTEIRDQLGKQLAGKKKKREWLVDWAALNKALGQPERTLAWYDEARTNPRNAAAIELIARNLEPQLIEAGRWAELGELIDDPIQRVRSSVQMLDRQSSMTGLEEEQVNEIMIYMSDKLRGDAANYYAACLAAGRETDAGAIASMVLARLDDSKTRFRLVETALLADQPRERHVQWLAEVEPDDMDTADLQKQLRRALSAHAGRTE